MADHADAHADESMAGARGADGDAHAEAAIGPVDVQAWGAAAGGVFLGLLVVLALIQALS